MHACCRQLFAGLAAIGSALLAGSEPHIVISETAGLYADAKQQALLRKGEIVEAEKHEWNRQTLRVKFRGKEYLAPRKHFRTRREALAGLDQARREAEADVKAINKQLAANAERRLQLYNAVLLMQHHMALAYKAWTGGVQLKNEAVRLGNSGAAGKLISVVPEKKARKAIKDWQQELAELAKKNAALEDERRAAVLRIFQNHQQREWLEDRFRRYAKSPRTYLLEPRRAVRQVTITRKGAPAVRLNAGDWVWAQLHPDNPSTLLIRFRRQPYLAPRDSFAAWSELQAAYIRKNVELEDKAQRLQAKVKMLSERLKLYVPLMPDLRYRSNSHRLYVYIPKIQVRPGTNAITGVKPPKQPNLVYAQIIDVAQKTLALWRKQLEDIAAERRQAIKDFKAVREQQEAHTDQHKRLQAVFAAFRKKE